jgi:hypothetical protein
MHQDNKQKKPIIFQIKTKNSKFDIYSHTK